MTEPVLDYEKMIDDKMLLFDKYLERTNMDKKGYQYDGVKWCLRNEIQPLGKVDPNLVEYPFAPLLGKVDPNLVEDPFAPLFQKVDKVDRGGFIADEMGLGKTIMMIGTMVCNYVKRTLIVLPPILIDQWFLQIYRTTGHKALIYHGAHKKKITLDMLMRATIVITTYGAVTIKKKDLLLVKSLPDKLTDLHRIHWSRIVFDEAHHLRNANTCWKSVKLLRADIRWLVSGTPIQNSKRDFYNLCSVLNLPASFYTKSENLTLLSQLYILKRTKKQVGIQIPDAVIDKNIVEWKNKREKDLSEEIHSALDFSNVSFKGNNNVLVRMLGDKGVLPLLLRARQSCILPKLLAPVVEKLIDLGLIDNHIDNYKEALQCSSKLDMIVGKILEDKDNGNGKIVFCHFREEIDTIAQRLSEGGISRIAIFDGRFKNRDILNDKYDVLILQIQTGCEGLNLQENYSEIYFVSPHWNPAVEEQAIARCHRIGQKKIVVVNRFEMGGFIKDTKNVDNYVCSVQDFKKKIASDIIK
jgi:SNF2 family DNA or RNA helicase